MPIPLGIFATAGAGSAAAGPAYELISSTVTGSLQTSVTLSSIPSTYKHLQFRFVTRSTAGSGLRTLGIRVNGDSGANYSTHYLRNNGSSTQTGNDTGSSYMVSSYASSQVSDSYSIFVMDFLDYANTATFKTMRMITGMGQTSGSGTSAGLYLSNWHNTSAMSSVTFLAVNGGDAFVTGSRFSVYGIKG
jgi:hypothetical protein